MTEDVRAAQAPRPLWRQILEFPLTAFVIAAGLLMTVRQSLDLGFEFLPAGMSRDASDIVRASIMIGLLFALYKLVLRRLGEHPRDDLALQGAGRGLVLGAALGFVLMTVSVAFAALLGVYRITGWGSWQDFIWIFVRGGIAAGFIEELMFRGILFRWFEQLGGSWFALALTSFLFGAGHYFNENATVFSSVALMFEAGVILGAAYMYARSLWFPMGLHFGWNFTQGFIWGVPVSGINVKGLVSAQLSGNELLSGGAFGLEASVLTVAIIFATGLWLLRLAILRGRIERNWWSRRKLPRISGES